MTSGLRTESYCLPYGRPLRPGIAQSLEYLPFLLAVVFFCQYFVSQAWAQTEQAAITGTVTDATGAAVPQATVTATNVNTRVSAVAETNTLGYYNIPYLPIGQYTVKVEKAGFQGATVSGIALRINLIATINVELAVGGVQQEVTVRSTSVLLEQQQAALGQNIETTAILQLPNLGLNPYSLVKLTPGVLPNTGVQGIVQGGRAGTTEVLLDGADTRASCCSNLTYTPPLEAVQEFKLVTSNYSAEYGRSGGGALIAVGKMGTNEMHGSLYEFLRNDKINANGWTNNSVGTSRTAFRYNQYGGTAGGPVFIPKVYNGRNR
ncbi:MAG TPA: carboxypeptidase-like regulatory domain-containing protein, partial [Verrucomicrobiae bacterium]|nr:carboxypeptidase-like regulatory domain-containing protein [Verrucomicrobiae bacterium]